MTERVAMRYRMLGPLEVADGDRILDLGAPKQRAVLAVLLLERGRAVPTDRIVEAVWGDDPPPSVSAGLQAYVSNLRRLLPAGDAIERRAPGYLLRTEPDDVDRTAFLAESAAAGAAVETADWPAAVRAASAALALWRGPVLADLRDEPWVRVEADALDERRAETAERLITGLLGCGRPGEAVAAAQRLRAEDPLRERATWLLMLALCRAGRSVEALEVFREQSRRLDEELGLEPPAPLRDLQSAILRQDPALAEWPARPSTPAPVEQSVTAPRAPAAGLVGRDRELASAAHLFDGPPASVRWLVLTGPAGIGKTRLAEEALQALEWSGVRLIRTACPEDDGTPPWWPVRQLVRAIDADPDTLLTPPPDTGADVGRYAVYERLDQALTGLRSRTAVLVDDVQWADPASVRWLTHLAEAARDVAIDVVLTVRDEIENVELERLLAAVARRQHMRQIAVPPLDPGGVAELAEQVSGEPVEDATALTARTGGNPFFVAEYARLPREEREAGGMPVAVRSVLRRRLAGIDPEVLSVLRTAAVAGDLLDVDLLRTLTRLDRDELADLLDDAADHELVVPAPGGGGYRFAHGLLRDEVLAALSAPRRQRLHARIAEALQDAAGFDEVVRRATHLIAAMPLVDPDDVYRGCRAAALAAEDRWQWEPAAGWWAGASEAYAALPAARQRDEERDDLLVAHVTALARAGRRETVIAVIEAALLEAVRNDRIDSAGRLAAVTLRVSGIWPWTAFSVDPGPLLTRLIGIEPLVRGHDGAHSRVLAALAVGNYYDPDFAVPDRLSRHAIAAAERTDDADVLADALLGRALVLTGLASQLQETTELARRVAALPHRLQRLDAVLVHDMLSLCDFYLGDFASAEEHIREGAAGADALRLPIVRVQLRWIESSVALWHGDIDRSERLAKLADELHRQTELYIMNVDGFSSLTRAWERGDVGSAPIRLDDNPQMPWLRAALLIAGGRAEEALPVLRAAAARPQREVWNTLGERTFAAFLVARWGNREAARIALTAIAPFRHLVAAFGQTGHVGPVALAMAELHAVLDEPDPARELLAEARAIGERGDGLPTLLRARLLAAELDGAAEGEWGAIAAEAARIGMRDLAARASAGPERVPSR